MFALAALLLALFFAVAIRQQSREPLSPDDALYLAAAQGIVAGTGLHLPSGDPFVVRGPLFPLALAAGMESPLGADVGPRAVQIGATVAALLALVVLGWLWYGAAAGLLAGLIAIGSEGVLRLGSTYRIDPLAAALALAALVVFELGARRGRLPLAAAAGLLMGLGILTKETTLTFLPVPLFAALIGSRSGEERATSIRAWFVFALVAALACGPWWIWYWSETGRLFPTAIRGPLAPILVTSVVVLLAAGAAGSRSRGPLGLLLRSRRVPWPRLGVALVAAWTLAAGAAFAGLAGALDADSQGRSLLDRTAAYAPPPWLLPAALAWPILVLRLRVRDAITHLLIALALVPIAVVVVLNGWEVRHLLIGFLLLDLAVAATLVGALRAALRRWRHPRAASAAGWRAGSGRALRIATAAIVAAVLVVGGSSLIPLVRPLPVGEGQGWDTPPVRRTAAWLAAAVGPEDVVMSEWLYGSELYRRLGGRHPVPLVPTKELALQPEGPIFRATGTLFRFRDHVPGVLSANDDWLFLRRHPSQGYYVGLSYADLVGEIRARSADWLVLTGEHHSQSTTSFAEQLDALPGFSRAYQSSALAPRLIVYRIQAEALVAEADVTTILNGITFRTFLTDAARLRGMAPAEALGELGEPRIAVGSAVDAAAAEDLQRLVGGPP